MPTSSFRQWKDATHLQVGIRHYWWKKCAPKVEKNCQLQNKLRRKCKWPSYTTRLWSQCHSEDRAGFEYWKANGNSITRPVIARWKFERDVHSPMTTQHACAYREKFCNWPTGSHSGPTSNALSRINKRQAQIYELELVNCEICFLLI